MPVGTHEQPAGTARSAPEAPQAAAVRPSIQDVNELIESVRSVMMQAKNRQRSVEQTSEHGRVSVLFVLSKLGPMRASALAKECSLDLSTVSRHLHALENEGHVERSAEPDDKRAFQVGLTERGHDFVQEYWHNRVAAVHTALDESAWSADEVQVLAKLLDRFVRDTEGCMK
ncbi:MAG TPA: MarR family winged helix-turn-helix transcriptional regulator [Actinocrinis sp.]|uniref:MarR family winged helix-turn-helix transcriptional regulator n=1 Tax=Actinocrinis sp. TaxID=1920516 RepID=UPI002DDCC6C0|nr:MarR family winged helix-turn-helix transcriptional regulator [Actinocrinis sp.]HEV2346734.1 MarR family winged helix-turn-helix transcriptional regulator [Actinocrinis sp.]